MKKILITSGGTKEHIDEVRVLTNISTGKLGAKIADEFLNGDNEVYYVHTKDSAIPEKGETSRWEKFEGGMVSEGYEIKSFSHFGLMKRRIPHKNLNFYEVTDVQSVYDVMEKLVPEMDIVIHPMAVSDFGFSYTDVKLKSNDPEAFIESLRERIYQTPKILSHIKKWNPNCCLVSFKFENGLTNEELLKIAYDSLVKNNCDLVIANDKAEMKRLNSHMSYFVSRVNDLIKVDPINGKEEIAKEILRRC
jgi:phosphopantothenate---cysteine ligase (CTP)